MINLSFNAEEQAQLQRLDIQAIILFGSQAQGLSHANSDFDIAVIGHYSKASCDAIYDLMSNKINRLIDSDIVFLQDTPLELQKHVATYGQPLYLVSSKVFADFRQQVMLSYADFAPLRAIFSAGTISRI